MQQNGKHGWASCAITINGCARILSNPAYRGGLPLPQILERLQKATQAKAHQSLNQTASIADSTLFDFSKLLTGRQITDVYLLGLAVRNQCRLVTFDQRIDLSAVIGAKEKNLMTLRAV